MLTVKFSGLDKLQSNLKKAPRVLTIEVEKAIGRALQIAQRNAQNRTPVDTGNLKSSIGGGGGYFVQHGWRGEMGTNVKYAYWVEVRKDVRHNSGEWGYMSKGIEASLPYIQSEIEKTGLKVALSITQ